MEHMPDVVKRGKCTYCHQDLELESLKSGWEKEHHYKAVRCPCGKENWFKVDFQGSGHDRFFTRKENLETTLKRVMEK